jgi:DNA-binding SARP family transcriptional activator
MNMIKVTMLGQFSLSYEDHAIDDDSNRMKKVWLLIAYLLYHRHNPGASKNLLSLLQNGGFDDAEDPIGRQKALFYRVRTQLNQLEDGAGHTCILCKNGNYYWNPDIPVEVDAERFEALCTAASKETNVDTKLQMYLEALSLYKGDFLPKLSMELWVIPIATYYHELFLTAVEETLSLLEASKRWSEMITLCTHALDLEPYSESLYQHLMRAQLAVGDRTAAIASYERMSELLFETFGVMPSDQSRKLYREATKEINHTEVTIHAVSDQLREAEDAKGALLCEYDLFKLLYQVQARAAARTKMDVHIVLLSLHSRDGKALQRRSLDIAMDNLQNLMVANLRQGDILSRCSMSQICCMLLQANYENSQMVCRRLEKAFDQQYPHSPFKIHYTVQSLEPKRSPS